MQFLLIAIFFQSIIKVHIGHNPKICKNWYCILKRTNIITNIKYELNICKYIILTLMFKIYHLNEIFKHFCILIFYINLYLRELFYYLRWHISTLFKKLKYLYIYIFWSCLRVNVVCNIHSTDVWWIQTQQTDKNNVTAHLIGPF